MTTATGRRRPYAGSRFSDPDWASPPPAEPPAGFPPMADDEPDEPGFHQPATEPPLDEPAPPARHPGPPVLSKPDTGDASGFLLGLFATVLLLQYLHGGTAQVRKWLAAKFLNRDGNGYGFQAAPNGRTLPIPAGGDPSKPGTNPTTGLAPDHGIFGSGIGALPDPSRITSPSAKDPHGRPY